MKTRNIRNKYARQINILLALVAIAVVAQADIILVIGGAA